MNKPSKIKSGKSSDKGAVPKGFASSKIPVRVKWQGAGSVRHGSGRGKRHG